MLGSRKFEGKYEGKNYIKSKSKKNKNKINVKKN